MTIRVLSVTKVSLKSLPEFTAKLGGYFVYNYAFDVKYILDEKSNKEMRLLIKKYDANFTTEASLFSEGSYDANKELHYDPYIYNMAGHVDDKNHDNLNIYHFYFSPISVPLAGRSVFSYNLVKTQSDVCFKIHGGTMLGRALDSQSILISASKLK